MKIKDCAIRCFHCEELLIMYTVERNEGLLSYYYLNGSSVQCNDKDPQAYFELKNIRL